MLRSFCISYNKGNVSIAGKDREAVETIAAEAVQSKGKDAGQRTPGEYD